MTTTKLVLPSLEEIRQEQEEEISLFCSYFELEIYNHSYGRWVANFQGCNIQVIAAFEKSPKIIIGDIELTLPHYGEELEEIVSNNWGMLRCRFLKGEY